MATYPVHVRIIKGSLPAKLSNQRFHISLVSPVKNTCLGHLIFLFLSTI